MLKNKILIVDDEQVIRFAIRRFLTAKGYDVDEATDCAGAEEACRANRPDLAIVDYMMPDGNAIDLLPRLMQVDSDLPVIILTGHGSIDLAVQAIKEGAAYFLTKPVDLPILLTILKRVITDQRARRKEHAGKAQGSRDAIDPFFGDSPAINRLSEQVKRVLSAESPVLIQGETGCGKGILARWFHHHGPRSEEAFVDLNCAGLSRELLETELFGHQKGAFTGAATEKVGLLDIAHRGTVFLDEIGDMDLQIQPKLLKVLEEQRFRRVGDVRDRQVDIRLIAATHRALEQMVRENNFRSDLYFRVSTIPLTVPSLRERTEDILPLARNLLQKIAASLGRGEDLQLAPAAEKALQDYPWPGNIRELRNVLERAVLLSDKKILATEDLLFSSGVVGEVTLDESKLTLREMEQQHIIRVLRQEQGHVETAARTLGIPRSTLYQKIKRYQIELANI